MCLIYTGQQGQQCSNKWKSGPTTFAKTSLEKYVYTKLEYTGYLSECSNGLNGSAQRFVGPEPVLGASWQNIRRKMKRWIENKHLVLWRGPCSTQRQVRELISGPDLATGARLLSFNRTQTRVVTGLLTGPNTLRRHLHIMWLCNDPMCKKCGTEEETSVHILCECEALASLRHAHLGSFFLDPEDKRELGVGAIWNFAKGTGLL
jgi:hypothetical protein